MHLLYQIDTREKQTNPNIATLDVFHVLELDQMQRGIFQTKNSEQSLGGHTISFGEQPHDFKTLYFTTGKWQVLLNLYYDILL